MLCMRAVDIMKVPDQAPCSFHVAMKINKMTHINGPSTCDGILNDCGYGGKEIPTVPLRDKSASNHVC